MKEAYIPSTLPLKTTEIDISLFLDELIDASSKLEIYKEKVKDSKVNSSWFMPTLQRKEALASSVLEGTQATFDGVLLNQVNPDDKDKGLVEVSNYFDACINGLQYLSTNEFSDEFFCILNKELLKGVARKNSIEIGCYRKSQNYIAEQNKNTENKTQTITYIPPKAENVKGLMSNLIAYMNNSNDNYRSLVRAAIIHAQFETIHPFMDGNGRVGRMLIPLYLCKKKEMEFPCFFISEAFEHDKLKYYKLLNEIRTDGDWNSWIKFFLSTVAKQCDKYIKMISDINRLYEIHSKLATKISSANTITKVLDCFYKYPILTLRKLIEITHLPTSSAIRCLTKLVDADILVSDNKNRNKTYFCYDLFSILKQ